jgi:heptosyltransferase-2
LSESPGQRRHLLVIRLTALGDVLLATPLLRALRKAFPEAEIDWLVEGNLRPLLIANPHLSRALPDSPWGHERLRQQRYDLIVDLQNKPRTFWLRTRLRPRRSVVLRKRSLVGALASLFGRDPPERGPSAVDRNLAVATALGIPLQGRELDLSIPPIGSIEAAPLLARTSARPIGLAPGAAHATKRWPYFAELGQRLIRDGRAILLLGGLADVPVLDAVGSALGTGCLGDTRLLSVAGLAAAIAGCSAIVSNDSGPAHIAAAVGTPALVLFGPTSPERWTPPGRLVRALSLNLSCSPCTNHGGERCPIGTHACMKDLTVAQVEQALASIWIRTQSS